MTLLAVYGGMVLGGLLVGAGVVITAKYAMGLVTAANAERRDATDRLVTAWKEGYQIAPAAETAPTASEDEAPLPTIVEDYLDQYDDDSAWRRKAWQLRRQGYSPSAIVNRLSTDEVLVS